MKNEISGLGLGLRFDHIDYILENKPKVPWFEVILDDFLLEGPHHKKLEKIRESYPIVFHSVGLNLGGVDSFNQHHLEKVKKLYEQFQPVWVSDHLCWSSHNGRYHHDLLPIPRTYEAFVNVSDRINYLQDFFNREIAVENITSYIDFKDNEYTEINFIKSVVKSTGCNLLLDISNVTINHKNRGLDYNEYINEFPLDKVVQIHLSGGEKSDGVIIDSHSKDVQSYDTDLLLRIYKKGLKIPAMIERDSNIPKFEILEAERNFIQEIINEL